MGRFQKTCDHATIKTSVRRQSCWRLARISIPMTTLGRCEAITAQKLSILAKAAASTRPAEFAETHKLPADFEDTSNRHAVVGARASAPLLSRIFRSNHFPIRRIRRRSTDGEATHEAPRIHLTKSSDDRKILSPMEHTFACEGSRVVPANSLEDVTAWRTSQLTKDKLRRRNIGRKIHLWNKNKYLICLNKDDHHILSASLSMARANAHRLLANEGLVILGYRPTFQM